MASSSASFWVTGIFWDLIGFVWEKDRWGGWQAGFDERGWQTYPACQPYPTHTSGYFSIVAFLT